MNGLKLLRIKPDPVARGADVHDQLAELSFLKG
jgi:hypothetical protein